MFQFPRFAFNPYLFRIEYLRLIILSAKADAFALFQQAKPVGKIRLMPARSRALSARLPEPINQKTKCFSINIAQSTS